jgi:hypothetical protein
MQIYTVHVFPLPFHSLLIRNAFGQLISNIYCMLWISLCVLSIVLAEGNKSMHWELFLQYNWELFWDIIEGFFCDITESFFCHMYNAMSLKTSQNVGFMQYSLNWWGPTIYDTQNLQNNKLHDQENTTLFSDFVLLVTKGKKYICLCISINTVVYEWEICKYTENMPHHLKNFVLISFCNFFL